MRYTATFALLSLLTGALAGGGDQGSDCVMTRILPTVTVGCSENLSGATAAPSPHAPQQPGHQSYPSGTAKPVADRPGTQSVAAKPYQSTQPGSSGGSDIRPVINGHSGSNATAHTLEPSDAPHVVSGASGLITYANAEVIIASLLAYLVPILIRDL
ncbi:hypothetical protein H9Q69_002508 [Fusarium xylarioides]|uniref:Uncharacterized protein n=1 Tax=Fusarium xylarioides TaxID=221167 RepID=A0A9P7LJQ5_9HYPO|nr:hypothetical protein H9Q72_007878 [Fusarium xylarioides]KAG5798440.1 hypothetical protein H9Q69_002508 [Fusarium xylarioides]KAG5807542.1 hypothetical protein H9Q71_007888 [Fusarium xylarioides]KAG5822517.1 hypothetical protein H9Q74_007383 [Fusarium xylarioides]